MVAMSQNDEGAIIIGVKMRELLVPLLTRPNDWWGTEKKIVQITLIREKKKLHGVCNRMFVLPCQMYMLKSQLP